MGIVAVWGAWLFLTLRTFETNNSISTVECVPQSIPRPKIPGEISCLQKLCSKSVILKLFLHIGYSIEVKFNERKYDTRGQKVTYVINIYVRLVQIFAQFFRGLLLFLVLFKKFYITLQPQLLQFVVNCFYALFWKTLEKCFRSDQSASGSDNFFVIFICDIVPFLYFLLSYSWGKKDWTKRYIWSKTTLIASDVGRTRVDLPPTKMDTFFLRSLALSVPIYRNFQSNGANWRNIKCWTKKFILCPII